MKNWKLDLALVGMAAIAIAWLFETFATNERVDKDEADDARQAYWDRLDDLQETRDEDDNPELENAYLREVLYQKAIACGYTPEWERCSVTEE